MDNYGPKTSRIKDIEFEAKLEGLFNEKPVSVWPYYVSSYTMQERKQLIPFQTKDRHEYLEFTKDLALLPACIATSNELGIYEKSVLLQILTSPANFIAFRAGARSGKTSTIKVIKEFCDKNRDHCKKTCQNLSCCDILIIDVLSYTDEDLTIKDITDNDEINFRLKVSAHQFINSLANTILAVFREHFYKTKKILDLPEEVQVDVFFRFFKEAIDFFKRQAGVGAFSNISSSLDLYLDPEKFDSEKSQRGKIKVLEDALDLISIQGKDYWSYSINKLETFLLPAAYSAFVNKERALVIVIDNIDHLSIATQEEMVKEFRRIVDRANLNENGRFKILIPVRLATFERIHGIGATPKVIEHRAITPSDILFYKVNYLLINNLSKIKDGLLTPYLTTLLALLAHVTDPKGYFKGMLNSVSGTNIANAYLIIKNWCLDEEIRTKTSDTKLEMLSINLFNNHLAISLLEKMWDATLNALDVSLARIQNNYLFSPNWVEEAAKDFTLLVSNLLLDYKLLTDQYSDSQNEFLLKSCSQEILNVLAENITNMKRGYEESLLLRVKVNSFLNTIISKLEELKNKSTDIDSKIELNNNEIISFVNQFVSYVFKNIDYEIEKAYYSHNIKIDENRLNMLKNWFKIVLNKICIISPSNLDNITVRNRIVDMTKSPFITTVFKEGPNISRYLAGKKILINTLQGLEKASSESVVNIFTDNRNLLSTLLLNILYKIYSKPGYKIFIGELLGYLEVTEQLEKNNFDRLASLMSKITSLHNRLIYSNAEKYHANLQNIVRNEMKIFGMSVAGKAYIEDLIITPPYMQWALVHYEDNNITSWNFIRQLNKILDNIDSLFDDEYKRLASLITNEKQKRILNEVLPSIKIPILDVFIRSFEYFIPAFNSHYRNIKKMDNKTEMKESLELFKRWISFGDKSSKLVYNLLNYENINWDENLVHYDNKLFRITGKKIFY